MTAALTMAALVARHVRPRIVLPPPPPRPLPKRLPAIIRRDDAGEGVTLLLDGRPVASVRPDDGGWRVRNLAAGAKRRLETRMEALALAHRIARILAP